MLALERGEDRDTVPDFAYPKIVDELTYGVRYKLMQHPAKSTLTVRHGVGDMAVPYRSLGSFLPGDGVGGAGVHWNGHTWRPQPEELRLRSYVEENFGADIIPDDMTIQDYGVSYDELEPFFDYFEKVAGISGKAGNLNGDIQEGGNPFEVGAQMSIRCRRWHAPITMYCLPKWRGIKGCTLSPCQRPMRRKHTPTPTACSWGRVISAAFASVMVV